MILKPEKPGKKKKFDDFKICEKKVILESHRSNSCRWIPSDLMQCNTSGRGLTSQTEGRGTLSSLCLRGKKEERDWSSQRINQSTARRSIPAVFLFTLLHSFQLTVSVCWLMLEIAASSDLSPEQQECYEAVRLWAKTLFKKTITRPLWGSL